MILVMSDPTQDGHVRPVLSELRRRGQEVKIYDPGSFPGASQLTVEFDRQGMRSVLRWGGEELALDRLRAVWYRRPNDFVFSEKLLPQENAWIRIESQHLFGAAWEAADCFWVSRPGAVRRASLKLLQKQIALGLGFSLPRSIVTNDVDRALSFVRSCESGVVVKVLASPAIAYGEYAGNLYTHLLTPDDLEMIDSVSHGPTFFQEFIPKVMDVRVTVIGDQVFAVGISPLDDGPSSIDFRRVEIYDLPHEVVTLPDALRLLCVRLVEQLGLSFGAIDFVLTSEGEYIFLEINPNGQWLWLEDMTGLPLSKTLAELLLSR